MGKITIKIFLDDNSTIIRKIKNPSNYFTLSYILNDKKIEKKYRYRKDKIITEKGFLFNKKIIMYKEGYPEPLSTEFKTKDVDMGEIEKIIHTGIFDELIKSTRKPIDFMMIIIVFGVIVIVGIVFFIYKTKTGG